MTDFKETIRDIAKVVGGLAGLVFLLAPITTKHGLEIGGGAAVIAILCAVVYVRTNRKDKDSKTGISN
jgi:hypothetical protein